MARCQIPGAEHIPKGIRFDVNKPFGINRQVMLAIIGTHICWYACFRSMRENRLPLTKVPTDPGSLALENPSYLNMGLS